MSAWLESGRMIAYQVGIGPYTETATLKLVGEILSQSERYRNIRTHV